MSIKITIEPGEQIQDQSGISSKTGKPYRIKRQTAYLHGNKAFPTPFDVSLKDDQAAYPPGEYTIGASSLKVGPRGLEIDSYNIVLEAVRSNVANSSMTPKPAA